MDVAIELNGNTYIRGVNDLVPEKQRGTELVTRLYQRCLCSSSEQEDDHGRDNVGYNEAALRSVMKLYQPGTPPVESANHNDNDEQSQERYRAGAKVHLRDISVSFQLQYCSCLWYQLT